MFFRFGRWMKDLFLLRTMVLTILSTLIGYVKCKMWGVQIGNNITFLGRIIIYREPGSKIRINSNCLFNSSSFYNFRGMNHSCIIQTGTKNASIIIGDKCSFSGVSIVCDNHICLGNNVRVGANSSIADRDGHGAGVSSVFIEDNVWLGMNVQVLKGVHIGKNSVIGAGSIVTKDIPANVIAAGNPCKVIKQIIDAE